MTSGPPYPLPYAALGGLPVPGVDDAICAVLLVFFIVSAVVNMTILQVNRRRGHKFLISGMVFGFSQARITALVMRIVWASRPTNIRIAIAAQIFTVAGVVLLFLVNLIFAQRLLRAYRPRLGWSRPVGVGFRILFLAVPACLVMVIPATIDSFYTLSTRTRAIDRRVQLVGTTIMALLAFLPIPITLLTLLAPPRPRTASAETFGQGRMRTKVALLLFTSVLLALGACFRAAVNFRVRPRADPAWYHSKACYYVLNFVIEIVVVYVYMLSRFDRRFHIPDGSSAPGHYAAGGLVALKADADAAVVSKADSESQHGNSTCEDLELAHRRTLTDRISERINDEEDYFGAGKPAGVAETGTQGRAEPDKGRDDIAT